DQHMPAAVGSWRRHATGDPRELFAYEDAAVATFDAPAGGRSQRRGRQRLPTGEAEAGVMPGTAHGVPNTQPLGQRAAVMSAGRADSEDLLSATGQQDAFTMGLSCQHCIAGELRLRNAAVLEIRTTHLDVTHKCSSEQSRSRQSAPVGA